MLALDESQVSSQDHLWLSQKIGGTRYDAICYRPDPRLGFSLSLAPLHSQEGVIQHPQLADFYAEIARAHGVTELYGPSVADHSALIADQNQLTVRLSLPRGVTLFRNKRAPSDGVPLRPRQGAVMSNAGCPALAIEAKGYFFFVHASRLSMLDHERIRTGIASREHESVLHAIAQYLKRKGVKPKEIRIRGHFHISPKIFDHPLEHSDPTIAAFNKKLFDDIFDRYGVNIMTGESGNLDMAELVKGVAEQLGFSDVKFTDPLPYGYATTRQNTSIGISPSRNAVFLIRQS